MKISEEIMIDEKWEDLIFNIDQKFGIESQKTEDLEIEDGLGQKEKKGKKEIVIFNTDIGKMKLERTTKPLILEKKVHYKKTKAQSGQVEYIFSDTEKTHKVTAYRWNDQEEDWEEIDLSKTFST